jgi:hypothetical protein
MVEDRWKDAIAHAKDLAAAGLTLAPIEPSDEQVDEMAVRLLIADEGDPATPEMITWARKCLGIGESLEHFGDCIKMAVTCRLCERERYQSMARAVYPAAIKGDG